MYTRFEIDGTKIRINGALTYSEYPDCPEERLGMLMNCRFIQGVFDAPSDRDRFQRFGRVFDPDMQTDNLIAQLQNWYDKGIRAITVGFQGGGACYTINAWTFRNSPYSEDGRVIDPAYLARMKRLIEAADRIGMLVIVSFFYVAQVRFLKDDLAVINAVKTASNWLRDEGFTNVIIEVANEHDVAEYKIHPILFDPKGIVELIDIARRESGGLPVGCSSTDAYFPYDIANASDIILIHGNNMTRQEFHQYILKAKAIRPKRPIVCNEDSQALGDLQVALDNGISWGYYNNMTKQEPPTDWRITPGEDLFFTARVAEAFGIEKNAIPEEAQFRIMGLDADDVWEGKRWIRLAAMYPEKIRKVDFYRDGAYFDSAYDDPFSLQFRVNWLQGPIEGILDGERWTSRIFLSDGSVIEKEAIAGSFNKNML